jgi:hypothetical protein
MTTLKTRPIVQYWHQENAPHYIEELFATFCKHNPDRQHLIFSERTACNFIADRFGAREVAAFRACAVPAMQADYFRLCAIYSLGGMWCDADSQCKASLDQIMDLDGGELFEPERPGLGAVNNAFLVFGSPGHTFLELTLEIATSNIEKRAPKFFVAGPELLTILVLSQRWGSFDAVLSACDSIPRQPRKGHSPEHQLLAHLRGALDPLEPKYLKRLREMIDARAAESFEGVHVSPAAKLRGFISHHPWPLPYQDTEDHHAHFKGSIYRTR